MCILSLELIRVSWRTMEQKSVIQELDDYFNWNFIFYTLPVLRAILHKICDSSIISLFCCPLNAHRRSIDFSWAAVPGPILPREVLGTAKTGLASVTCDPASNNQQRARLSPVKEERKKKVTNEPNRRRGIVLGRLQRQRQQCRRHHRGLLKERRAGEWRSRRKRRKRGEKRKEDRHGETER